MQDFDGEEERSRRRRCIVELLWNGLKQTKKGFKIAQRTSFRGRSRGCQTQPTSKGNEPQWRETGNADLPNEMRGSRNIRLREPACYRTAPDQACR
jgi:hypothetical protein